MSSKLPADMAGKFSEQAQWYAKYRPSYPDEMYDFIMQHVEKAKTAWDCATGSGQVAGELANYFEQVYATDISSEQLRYAPQKRNITYLEAPAENSGLPNGLFNLITVGQAIHWFSLEEFYREVRRTSGENAVLAVIGYGKGRVKGKANSLIDRFYDAMFKTYFLANRKFLDGRYRDISFPFEEITAPSFEISCDWSLHDLEGYLNSWSAVQKFKEEKKYNPAVDFIRRLQSEADWQPEEIREVTFPIFMRLGRITS